MLPMPTARADPVSARPPCFCSHGLNLRSGFAQGVRVRANDTQASTALIWTFRAFMGHEEGYRSPSLREWRTRCCSRAFPRAKSARACAAREHAAALPQPPQRHAAWPDAADRPRFPVARADSSRRVGQAYVETPPLQLPKPQTDEDTSHCGTSPACPHQARRAGFVNPPRPTSARRAGRRASQRSAVCQAYSSCSMRSSSAAPEGRRRERKGDEGQSRAPLANFATREGRRR